ncbi:AAA family ATPase [Collimonas fungivorans]|uniref:AAA family ATPase n=1 Tax=Collimonas fungivorans TaxID=158899 RepID=UPI0009EE7668|nr:AAA family ATPase [Collimonas fungivorans]
MKLAAFRVQNYRSIIDSGWVSIDDIAVIVGKNESGKTSLLKALLKFNPFKAEPYSLDREWPAVSGKTALPPSKSSPQFLHSQTPRRHSWHLLTLDATTCKVSKLAKRTKENSH